MIRKVLLWKPNKARIVDPSKKNSLYEFAPQQSYHTEYGFHETLEMQRQNEI